MCHALGPRVQRYLTECAGNHSRAVQQYSRYAEICSELWLPIGHTEVLLRRAMQTALVRAWGDDWFEQIGFCSALTDRHQDQLAEAIGRAGGNLTSDAVSAALGFGFWRLLLARTYDRSMWTPHLRHAFPGYRGARAALYERVNALNDDRNIIGHHGRLKRSPAVTNADIIFVVSCISTDATAWVRDSMKIQPES